MNATQLAPMSATISLPVLPHAKIHAYPKHAEGAAATYTPIGVMLTKSYATDAHFAAYAWPDVQRRLCRELLRNEEHRAKLPARGVEMMVMVFDVDCAASHVASGAAADDAWWASERAKLERLDAEHPGAFVYRTRGGYRIVYVLATPFALREPSDEHAWTASYVAACASLKRRFDITADVACSDWPRLFRLPRSTRAGEATSEQRDTIGDAHAIGAWLFQPTSEDSDVAKKLKPAKVSKRKPVDAPATTGEGILFHAMQARDLVGPQHEIGAWRVVCPNDAKHSKGERYDGSTLLYAPGAGGDMGYVHCLHAHCAGLAIGDSLRQFSEGELAAARKAAGIPQRAPANDVVFKLGDDVEIGTMVNTILAREGKIVFSENELRRYDGRGLWRTIGDDAQSLVVQSFSGAPVASGGEGNSKPLKIYAGGVAGSLRLAHQQIAQAHFFANAPEGLTFANGFCRVTANDIVLEPHSAEQRSRYGYDFAFNLGAPAPRFERFLQQLFEGASDARERIDFLQQFFGACLLGIAPRFQKALVPHGTGANGKSTLIDTVVGVMPVGTTSAIAPQDLGQEYRRALLVGKRLNVVNELPSNDIIDGESFKAIVSGDPIVARPIREAPFTFVPTAGHCFAANALPGVSDTSDGFWRRLAVIGFDRTFAPAEQIPDLAKRIVHEERAGVLTWLLRGAQALLQQGRYTKVPSAEDAVKKWRRDANPVAVFLEEKCAKIDHSMGASATFLYDAYRTWCHRSGHHPVSLTKFGMRMRDLGAPSEHGRAGGRYPYAVQP